MPPRTTYRTAAADTPLVAPSRSGIRGIFGSIGRGLVNTVQGTVDVVGAAVARGVTYQAGGVQQRITDHIDGFFGVPSSTLPQRPGPPAVVEAQAPAAPPPSGGVPPITDSPWTGAGFERRAGGLGRYGLGGLGLALPVIAGVAVLLLIVRR